MTEQSRRRPVAVVTGGGGGIGTAVALELGRRGIAVVAMDPGVGLQGEPLNEPTAAQTAQRITAEGGVARASTASVTDRAAVRSLFAEVVGAFGSLDIVVNTAGILRFAPFLDAGEDDWRAVLDVHLNGYLNVLSEALPVMAAAGYGRIVGVTSGAGLARAAGDSAAYACAKRAVAAVTWQLAGLLPDGIALNALSPLAATRMTAVAITGGSVTAGAMTGGSVTAGAMTGGSVIGGSVTGGSVIGGSVTGGSVIGGSVTGGSVTGGSVTGGSVTGGSVTGGDVGRRPAAAWTCPACRRPRTWHRWRPTWPARRPDRAAGRSSSRPAPNCP